MGVFMFRASSALVFGCRCLYAYGLAYYSLSGIGLGGVSESIVRLLL